MEKTKSLVLLEEMDGVKTTRSLSFDVLLVIHGMDRGHEGIAYVGTALGITPDRTLEIFTTLKNQPKSYLDKVAAASEAFAWSRN